MLDLNRITKNYKINHEKFNALNNVSVKFDDGKFYGIIGHSGSGKSTLINILGLLDSFDDGKYTIDKINVTDLSENEKSDYRRKYFGFVFQSFYLNKNLNSLENVIVPMLINDKLSKNEREMRAKDLLIKLGLGKKFYNKPSQLSGGEQQRVAIARALANDPKVIIADEPTGNLDKKNEKIIFDYLKKVVLEEKKTVIVVSHNDIVNDYAEIIYEMEQGNLKMKGI